MAKYKKATEQLVEDFVNKVFRAIGSAIRPAVLKHLSNKDPEFGKLVKDLEQSRNKVDTYLKTKTNAAVKTPSTYDPNSKYHIPKNESVTMPAAV